MSPSLTREQRAELKRRLRRAPQYRDSGVDVSRTTVSDMLSLAQQWSVPIPTAAEAVAQSAQSAFPDDLPAEPAASSAPSLDVDAAVSGLLAKMGSGDFAGFQAGLRALAIEAAKPAKTVEVEKIVTVEKVVEIEAAAEHLRPSHQPSVVGTVEVAGHNMEKWDAPDAPSEDKHYSWPAGTRVALTKIKRQQPIFLAGPAGTGKTTFAEQVAAVSGRPFVRISCHEQTDGPTLVGMTVPDGKGGVRWQDGQLTKAIRRAGTIILIDEPSTARAGAMMILQAILEPNGRIHIEQTGEVVRRAPGVTFILADNTAGHGDETGQYEATRRMNRATLDRMAATILIDYLPKNDEIRVLMNRSGIGRADAEKLVSYAILSRDAARKGNLTHGVGLRRLIAWAEAMVDGITTKESFAVCVLNAAAPDDREGLRQLAEVHL